MKRLFAIDDEVDPMRFEKMLNMKVEEYPEKAVIMDIDRDARKAWVTVTIVEEDGMDDREEHVEVPFSKLELMYEEDDGTEFNARILSIKAAFAIVFIFLFGLLISQVNG